MDIMNEIGEFGDSGGYDLNDLAKAKESLGQNKDVNTTGMKEVDPIFIQVTNANPVRSEELEARMVIIEYDEFDEIVSVELL